MIGLEPIGCPRYRLPKRARQDYVLQIMYCLPAESRDSVIPPQVSRLGINNLKQPSSLLSF